MKVVWLAWRDYEHPERGGAEVVLLDDAGEELFDVHAHGARAGARRCLARQATQRFEFRMLTNPVELLGDERGWLTGVRCVRMELGEPGADGRRKPVPVAGSEFVIDASLVIVAVGTSANPLVQSTTPDLKTTKKNYIEADPDTLRTSKRGVFAGGDIVTGGATVILAMGAGRKAAKAIGEYLSSGAW